jgi:hypothetical protein
VDKSQGKRRVEVNVATQVLSLWEGGTMVKSWPCSTALAGTGFGEGSLRTPLGWFAICQKIGGCAPGGTIFKGRIPVGLWRPGDGEEGDLVLTRILRLDGREERNRNTLARYIYVHGTNGEAAIGKPASHGCVRLRNADMVELFDLVEEGDFLWIAE